MISKRTFPRAHFHAVIDSSNNSLVAIGRFFPAMVFLNEALLDTWCMPYIEASEEVLNAVNSSPRSFPEWSWSNAHRTLIGTNPAVVTEYLRERAELAEDKRAAITRIIFRINLARKRIDTGLIMQQFIYAEKEREATMFLESAHEVEGTSHFPYVVQYAEYSDISLAQAAEEISFQARLDREYLLRTEQLRLVYFQKIKLAKTSSDVAEYLKRFLEDITK